MGLGRWKFFTCEVFRKWWSGIEGVHNLVEIQWHWEASYGDLEILHDLKYILCLIQRTMFVLNCAESNMHWDYLPGFWMLLVRVAGIWCRTIGDWVDRFIWYLVSNLNFRVFTKSLAANYRINLMTLIRHCMSPHYRCPLFSLFCDLSSNHVQHTMIAMWSTHCEESPPKKDCSLFPWISNLHGSTKHDLQRHYHHIFMLEELQ